MRAAAIVIAVAATASTPAHSQSDPAKIVAAMERIVAAYQKAAQEKTWFLYPCTASELRGSWAATRFEFRALKYDVKRTDSLIDPIVGTIDMTITTYTNGTGPAAELSYQYSPTKKACYRDKATALSRSSDSDASKNDSVRPFSVTYKIKDGSLYLSEGTEIFNNTFKAILETKEVPNIGFSQNVTSQKLQ